MLFTPPNLFSAFALSAISDPDLPDGRHIRLLMAPELGPPLGPVALWGWSVAPKRTGIDARGPKVWMPPPPEPGRRIVAAGGLGAVAILDRHVGEILRRSAAPAIVAAPQIEQLWLSNAEGGVLLYGVDSGSLWRVANKDPDLLLALPLPAPTPWHAGGVPASTALARVKLGAPKRQTVLDAPGGAPAPLGPDAEVARVNEAAQSGIFPGQLSALFAPGDPLPPAQRIASAHSNEGTPSSADMPIWGTLLLQAMDTGIGRFLGLMGTMKPVDMGQELPVIWATALFALAPDALTPIDPLTGKATALAEWPIDPDEKGVIERMVAITPGLAAVIKRAQAAGLQIRAAMTVAAAPPPPDTPLVGQPSLGTSAWIGEKSGPSTAWRQRFILGPMPAATSGLALARRTGAGAWTPRNPAAPSGRRQLILPGRDHDEPAAPVLLFDRVEPDGHGAVAYRFAAADLFGRFGDVRDLPVPPPPRPKLPRPVPQATMLRGPVPAGMGKASPGQVRVVTPVPGFESLAAGALPIAKVEVTLNGGTTTSAPDKDCLSTVVLPLPELAPMAAGAWPLTVRFLDSANTPSEAVSLTVAMTDARAPTPIKTGPGIVWTSRPTTAPEVEVALQWPAGGAAAHIYEASATSLASAANVRPDVSPTRAALAQALLGAAPPAGYPRSAFARVTVDPVEPDADGLGRYTLTLPRALRTLTFVRIVTVSPGGVESDFNSAGLVPVAVPDDMPPPAPRLTGTVDASGTKVTLRVEATGLDPARVRAVEPGLPPAAPDPANPAYPPEFRLRRARGTVTDPLYAPALDGPRPLALGPGPADPPFAIFLDESAMPFVPYTWWAEVRMPRERRLPPGVLPQPAAAGPAYNWQRQDMDRPFSRLSPPFSTIPAPALPPAKLAAGQVSITRAQVQTGPIPLPPKRWSLTVALSGLPVAAQGAIGSYQLRVWRAPLDGALARDPDRPITAPAMRWTEAASEQLPATLVFAVVDPLGREGDVLFVTT